MSWGPSHQHPAGGESKRQRRTSLVIGVLLFLVLQRSSPAVTGLIELLVFGGLAWRLGRYIWSIVVPLTTITRRSLAQWRRALADRQTVGADRPVLRADSTGAYLGIAGDGRRRFSRRERAVLVIGPPRSGKTRSVIIPTVLTHHGPVVSTSTKPDVLRATANTRSTSGRVWQFDPTGTADPISGVDVLRWSPVTCAHDWDAAMLMARAMVTATRAGTGTTDSTHWSRRAQALLAPLLHAAAIGDREIAGVLDWVTAHQLDEPATLLAHNGGSELAVGALTGLARTEPRERSSIFSTALDALDTYRSHAALDAASDPNFYPGRFARTNDTIYIHAPAEHQHQAAPLVCGLLAEIRRATYQAHAAGVLPGSVLFALDEVANIAPVDELPQIASEGASQGLLLLAALQDLSQARHRWGPHADGFLTLFGTKLILPGIADQRTLENISTTLGEYDRKVVSTTRTRTPNSWWPQQGQTISTQRTRVLSPGEIANIPTGRALHLDGTHWELITLTPANPAGSHHSETAGSR